jgi:hypothetical protein
MQSEKEEYGLMLSLTWQITLPPLIEDTEGREIVASGLRKSRARYRQFRSRLSQEVTQSKGKLGGFRSSSSTSVALTRRNLQSFRLAPKNFWSTSLTNAWTWTLIVLLNLPN